MDKPQGSLAAIFAIFAFIACNGLVILVAVLSFIGVSVSIDPHIQAAAISFLSMVTLGLVFRGFKQNRMVAPLILAAAATLTLLATMYIHFNKIVESLGLLALFASALWSWQINRARCARKSV
jgi:hypothetical protein